MDHDVDPETGYEVRPARWVVRWQLIDFLVLGALFVALLFYVVHLSKAGKPFGWYIAAAIGICAIAFARQQWRGFRLRCPECGARLKRREGERLFRVVFPYAHCRVVWDSRMTAPDDIDG